MFALLPKVRLKTLQKRRKTKTKLITKLFALDAYVISNPGLYLRITS